MKNVVLDADVEITDDGKVTNIRSIKDSVGNDVTQGFLEYCKKNDIDINNEESLRDGLRSFGRLL